MVSDGVTVDLINISSLDIEDLYGNVARKLLTLQAIVTHSSASLPLVTSSLRTRISHLSSHLAHLTTLALFSYEHYDSA